jgi:hypothetical protein
MKWYRPGEIATMSEVEGEIARMSMPPTTVGPDQPPRGISIWIPLVAVVALLALALPALLGYVYVADDLGEFHLPIRSFYAQQLASGQQFEWMPGLFGGFYIAAEGQLGAYHPFHWMLYRMLPLGVAFSLELLASYPFLFCGTWLFLRRISGSQIAGLYGALVFTFCSFMMLHFLHPNAIAVAAHMPWLLLTLDVALRTEVRRQQIAAEMALGLILGSQILLGYPQCVWFTALAAVSLVVFRYAQIRNPMKRIASIAAAAGMGIAIGAIQWLATLHLLENSIRKIADSAFINTGSLHPLNLMQLVAPYLFKTRVVGQNTHEFGLYVGAVPLVLCVWLMANRGSWGRYRSLVRALIFLGALSLLLAAGEYGGLYSLQSLIPLANRFRFPCRAIVLLQLCMAGGAGVAFALLVEHAGIALTNMRRPGLLVIVAAIAFAITWPILLPAYVSGPFLVWLGPALLALAVVLMEGAKRGSQVALFALVLFTAIDLAAYGLSYSVWDKTAKLAQYVSDAPLPPGGSPARVVAPSSKAGLSIGNQMLLAGLTRVDGYAGLQPIRNLDFSQESTWRLAGAQWACLLDREAGRCRWMAISPTAPRARLLASRSRNSLHIPAAQLASAANGSPINTTNFWDGKLDADGAEISILRDSPGIIAVAVRTGTPGMLAITESYDSGWRVTVDGRGEEVSCVDGDFLGCQVTAGKHEVQFEFRPRCRQLGSIVSLCGLGLLLLFCGFRLLSYS